MPIHPLWIILMSIILMSIIILPLVAIAVALTRGAGGHSGQGTKPPLFSPDGRWWWDGREWKPVPPPGSPPSPPA